MMAFQRNGFQILEKDTPELLEIHILLKGTVEDSKLSALVSKSWPSCKSHRDSISESKKCGS